MVEIFAVNINQQLNRPIFNHLMSFLPEEKQDTIKKFRRAEDAQSSLLADILVRTVICSKLSICNQDIVFYKNRFGKPFLSNSRDFQFNITHSGEWVICAVHHLPVGIDVEKIQPVDFNIAKRFFSNEEFVDLISLDSSLRLPYFYELWTLKESYIKAVGKGLSIPLDSFSFRIKDQCIEFTTQEGQKEYFFKQYSIDSFYKMAVCSKFKEFPEQVQIREISDVCEEAFGMLQAD